jgi:hypothetical protein
MTSVKVKNNKRERKMRRRHVAYMMNKNLRHWIIKLVKCVITYPQWMGQLKFGQIVHHHPNKPKI